MKTLQMAMITITAVPLLASCISPYRGAAIEATVVDAQNNQPIEGVVVVADWQLYGRPLHPDIIGRLLLQETVTNKQGRFAFPAWGPLRASEGTVSHSSPVFYLYKPGYRFQTLHSGGHKDPNTPRPLPLTSPVDKQIIELVPYQASEITDQSYVKELFGAPSLFSLGAETCDWQQMPRMTALLMRRGQEYSKRGVAVGMPHREGLHWNGKCADPDEVLKEYVSE